MNLSVIIIALNEEKYIGTLLNCLKNQTFKDFEVILVDGQSEDKTVEVAKGFSDDFELSIIVADKRGTGYQRNLGAKNTKYENLVFFDADNKLPDNFLEKVVEFIKVKGVDCMTGTYKPLEPSLYTHMSMFIHNVYLLSQKKVAPVATGTFMHFKKDAFNSVGGFDESILYGEDSDLVKRVVKKGYKFDVMTKPKSHFSFRRHTRDGKLKSMLLILKGTLLMQRGERFKYGGKIKYRFGHYNNKD